MTISRRNFITTAGAGGALAALGTLGAGTAAADPDRIALQQACDFAVGAGGRKPVHLPAPGSMDAAEHAKNDVLFWSDQLMEHGLFLAMLLPGAEAAYLRERSLEFQGAFQQHFTAVQQATVDGGNYRSVNQQTAELVKPFIDFKLSIEDALRTGQVRGLVYPTFAHHIAAEGDHFAKRLENLNRGEVEFDLGELVPFWARIMGEHALFAAHLMDPGYEAPLIHQAYQMAASFQTLASRNDVAGLAAAGEMILDFKETAETGIEAAEIESIIHPSLADHIRREAVKFLDELHRTVPGLAGGAQVPSG
jgi:hypothetical protein